MTYWDEKVTKATQAMADHMAENHGTYTSGLHVYELMAEHYSLHSHEHRYLDHEAAHDRVTEVFGERRR